MRIFLLTVDVKYKIRSCSEMSFAGYTLVTSSGVLKFELIYLLNRELIIQLLNCFMTPFVCFILCR
jgi:hypothetical protein